jgi:glycosyltransferase involved in cell wall biosynthesis
MKVWHFSTNDWRGGAAQAAYRLHEAMRDTGFESRMYVANRQSTNSDVHVLRYKSILRLHPREMIRRVALLGWYGARKRDKGPRTTFNRNLAPELDLDYLPSPVQERPDAIILHWISNCLNVPAITAIARRYRCPVIWIASDEEPYTGGCHYTLGCQNYKTVCRRCPQLGSQRDIDLAHFTWSEKQSLQEIDRFVLLGAGEWLYQRIRESSLFARAEVVKIPMPLTDQAYRPLSKSIAREVLQLPKDKILIMTGTTNFRIPRKGMDLFRDALFLFAKRYSQAAGTLAPFLILVGKVDQEWVSGLPIPFKSLGVIHSELDLALAYQAADVFVCPSLEDAGPQMISQAMLCGTPVVAFRTGIAPELVINDETGYIVESKDATSLANGIEAIVGHPGLADMGKRAAQVADQHHNSAKLLTEFGHLLARLTGVRCDL